MSAADAFTRQLDTLLDDLRRAEMRLARAVADRRHWHERAVAAEQALGLYGRPTPKPYRGVSYCDEATDSGHSSASGFGA
jgi:hypothetical protein